MANKKELVKVRVTPDIKDYLKSKGNMSKYIMSLIDNEKKNEQLKTEDK